MGLLHDYKFKWWELGIFKISLLSIGAILAVYWTEFFRANLVIVYALAIISTPYVIYTALKQK